MPNIRGYLWVLIIALSVLLLGLLSACAPQRDMSFLGHPFPPACTRESLDAMRAKMTIVEVSPDRLRAIYGLQISEKKWGSDIIRPETPLYSVVGVSEYGTVCMFLDETATAEQKEGAKDVDACHQVDHDRFLYKVTQ